MPSFISHDVVREDRLDGAILLRTRVPLGPVARNTGAWLHRWAKDAPDRVLLAERSGQGWRELRYADALGQVQSLASALLGRGLGPETPLVIISGNIVDHGLFALAAQIVPLAEQYSLVSGAYPRLQYAIEMVRPKMVFADDGAAYGAALGLPFLDGVEKIVARNASGSATTFAHLLRGDASADVDAARAKHVNPDVKISPTLWVGGNNPFSDPARGQERGAAMVADGADRILAAGAGSNGGIFKAFQDSPDAYAFGVDVNQCPQAPGVVMDNVEKKTDVAVELAIKGIFGGTQQPVTALGLSEGGMALTAFEPDVAASKCKIAAYPDAIAKVKALRDEIVSGALKIADPMTAK